MPVVVAGQQVEGGVRERGWDVLTALRRVLGSSRAAPGGVPRGKGRVAGRRERSWAGGGLVIYPGVNDGADGGRGARAPETTRAGRVLGRLAALGRRGGPASGGARGGGGAASARGRTIRAGWQGPGGLMGWGWDERCTAAGWRKKWALVDARVISGGAGG